MLFCAEEQIMKLYDEKSTHVLAEYNDRLTSIVNQGGTL